MFLEEAKTTRTPGSVIASARGASRSLLGSTQIRSGISRFVLNLHGPRASTVARVTLLPVHVPPRLLLVMFLPLTRSLGQGCVSSLVSPVCLPPHATGETPLRAGDR